MRKTIIRTVACISFLIGLMPVLFAQQRSTAAQTAAGLTVSGKVAMDDGTPVPPETVVEKVCGGVVRPQGHPDANGLFTFQLGTMNTPTDSSVLTSWSGRKPGQGSDYPSESVASDSATSGNDRGLMGCGVRAALSGYHSSTIEFGAVQPGNMMNVGTIFLQRADKVRGTVISATSLQAPKDAKKAFDKGMEAEKNKKWPDAQKQFEKAVQVFPQYANAWYQLGEVLARQGQVGPARKAYTQAMSADANFISPYFALAAIAVDENKWKDVLDLTNKGLALDSLDYPVGHFYNAAANYNLGNLPAAEQSALTVQRLDAQNHIPRVHLLLSMIYTDKKDYPEALAQIRTYLALVPNASDAEKARLVALEKLNGSAANKPN